MAAPTPQQPLLRAPQLDFMCFSVGALAAGASLMFTLAVTLQRARRVYPAYLASVAAMACSWWCVSTTLVLFNKLLMTYLQSVAGFPVTITTAHMAVKGALALGYVACCMALPPLPTPPPGRRNARSRARANNVCTRLAASQAVDWRVALTCLLPIGASTAVDVWLSQVAIRTLDVSVYSVTKSTALVFTFLLSLALRVMRPSVTLLLIVIGISAGVMLASARATGADMGGITAALGAAVASAVRWTVTERYYVRPKVEGHPVSLIALAAPFTVISLLPFLAWELPSVVAAHPFGDNASMSTFLSATLGGGVLAFALLIVELQLVSMTSALTLTVIGHLKEVFTVVIAVPVFHEQLSLLNWAGVVLAFSSAAAYSLRKTSGSHLVLQERDPASEHGGAAVAAAGSTPVRTAALDLGEDLEEDNDGEDEDGEQAGVSDSAPLIRSTPAAAGTGAASGLLRSSSAGMNEVRRAADFDDAGTEEASPRLEDAADDSASIANLDAASTPREDDR